MNELCDHSGEVFTATCHLILEGAVQVTLCADCGAEVDRDEDPTAGFLYESFWG